VLASAALGTIAIGVRSRNWTWIVVGVYILCFSQKVLLAPVNAWRAAGMLPVLWAFGPRPAQIQGIAEPEDSAVGAVA
jgi:hypothetical protein